MKKAQVTLFVVIAIMLVAAVATVLYVKPSILKPVRVGIKAQVVAVKEHVSYCVEHVAYTGLAALSAQGGYLAPEYYLRDGPWDIAYWYYTGDDLSPSLAEIEKQFSDYVRILLPFCANLTKFGALGIEISAGEVKTETKIERDFILLRVNYPIVIAKGDVTYGLKEFSAKLPIRLGEVYYLAKQVTDQQIHDESPESFCASCLVDFCSDSNTKAAFRFYDNESIVFTIFDEESAIDKIPYRFEFASKIR